MFYIKIIAAVMLGTLIAWIGVKTFVSRTDELADTFNVRNTVYLRDVEPAADVRVKTELEMQIAKERLALQNEALERRLERTGEEEEFQVDVNDIDEEVAAQVATEKAAQDAKEKDGNGGKSKAGGGTSNRADSDADMKKPPTEEEQLINNSIELARMSFRRDSDAKKTEDTVQALDLAYAPPDDTACVKIKGETVRVGVRYRLESFAIKGYSLSNIDQLIQLYKYCGGGKMLILQNAEGEEDTSERMIGLRQDEVKYYLLQRRVPKADMIFPDKL